jgi:uncharacterized protein (TIGR02300 family)
VAKPELGTKRLCGACGAKFYDLNKETIVCPKCGTVFEAIAAVTRGRAEMPARAGATTASKEPELEVAEAEGAEFISLEEADAEVEGEAKGVVTDEVGAEEEIEVDDESLDDAAFIEEEEEGDEDVTDIIGDGIEKEEET